MAAWLVGEARVAQGSHWIILEHFRAYLVRFPTFHSTARVDVEQNGTPARSKFLLSRDLGTKTGSHFLSSRSILAAMLLACDLRPAQQR